MTMPHTTRDHTLLGAYLFGIGLIAMLDGIAFHQLLQWHSMYMWDPSRYVQVFSDGVLHLIATAFVIAGAVVLWNSYPPTPRIKYRAFWSGLFFGGGTFNLLDGVFSHHLTGIHHVRPGHPQQFTYDLAFDASAVVMLVAGWLLYDSVKRIRHSTRV